MKDSSFGDSIHDPQDRPSDEHTTYNTESDQQHEHYGKDLAKTTTINSSAWATWGSIESPAVQSPRPIH